MFIPSKLPSHSTCTHNECLLIIVLFQSHLLQVLCSSKSNNLHNAFKLRRRVSPPKGYYAHSENDANLQRPLDVESAKFYVGENHIEVNVPQILLLKHSSVFKTALEIHSARYDMFQILRETFHSGIKLHLQNGGIYLPYPAFTAKSIATVLE